MSPGTPDTQSTSAQAFDRVAAHYDADSTDVSLSRWIRGRVWNRLAALFPAESRVLELGCGTGEDAVWLAQRGVYVTATDASPSMLAATRDKAVAAGVDPLITTRQLDLDQAAAWQLEPFDGAFSNYGALNCIGDWHALGAALAQAVKPGGAVAFAVMGRYCLWEIGWHTLHGNLHTAFRRLPGHATAHIGGIRFPVYYPTPRQFVGHIGAAFRLTRLMGLGVFIPPSDAYGAVGKHRRLAVLLQCAEQLTAPFPPFNRLADHFWVELRRR